MSEQNREARDVEDRYQRSQRAIRAGLDPLPRKARREPVLIEIDSSSTWSTADISTDAEEPDPLRNLPRAKGKAKPRVGPKPKPKPRPKPKPKPKAKAKAKQLWESA